MHFLPVALVALISTVVAAPENIQKRQTPASAAASPTSSADEIAELLQLASAAGITLPSNPTALVELGQAAEPLESALPTESVLSVLETAVPSGFLSSVLYNPSFAASFESAFSAGSSPSWFTLLPTDVQSYLHTYNGLEMLATAGPVFESAVNSIDMSASGAATAIGTAATATGAVSGNGTVGSSGSTSGSGTSSTLTTTTGAAVSTGATAAGGTGSTTASASGSSTATPSSAGSTRAVASIAAGLAGAVGILALAVVL